MRATGFRSRGRRGQCMCAMNGVGQMSVDGWDCNTSRSASVWGGQLGWRGSATELTPLSFPAHTVAFTRHPQHISHHVDASRCVAIPSLPPPMRARCWPPHGAVWARSVADDPRDGAPSLLTEMVLRCFTLLFCLRRFCSAAPRLLWPSSMLVFPPCASVPSGLRAAFVLGLHLQAAPRTCLRRTSVPCKR
jgi:hypothetical protein